MRAVIDHDRCEGNGRCQAVAPEAFELRDNDLAYPLLDDIPPELQAKVVRAIALCPRQAIAWAPAARGS